MAKIIKNTTNADILHTASGINFAANSNYTLEAQDALKLIDSQTFDLLASGDFVFNDGTNDVTNSATAWSYLTGEQVLQQDAEKAQYFLPKYAPTGWSYEGHPVEFKTSQLDSVYSKTEALVNTGYATIKLYDASDVEITTQENADLYCVKTCLIWEPTVDYLIVAGRMVWREAISQDVRVWVMGVPDVSFAYGGSRVFVGGINLRFFEEKTAIITDGKAPKRLNYSATYHTGKFRYTLRHPAGYKLDFQLINDIYKA